MTNQIQTEQSFLDFIADQAMANGNLSTRGVARCCDVQHTSLIRDGALKSEKLAKNLAQHGFLAGALSESGWPPAAVWLAIEYYAFESRTKTLMAKQIARTFGAIGVKTTLEKLVESKKYPRQLVGDVPANPTQQLVDKVNIVFDGLFSTIDPSIRTGMKIEAMIAVDPTLRPILEPHKPKMLIEAALLSPTELGKLMEQRDGITRSGQAMNKLLIEKGLQVSTGDKALAYRAIGQGVEFSRVIADTAKGHGKTVQSLRWYESVIDLLIN